MSLFRALSRAFGGIFGTDDGPECFDLSCAYPNCNFRTGVLPQGQATDKLNQHSNDVHAKLLRRASKRRYKERQREMDKEAGGGGEQ